MKRFENGQRVRVTEGELIGRTGTVRRVRIADDGAWVRMDTDLPDLLQSFAADDDRHRDAILYPDECELEPQREGTER